MKTKKDIKKGCGKDLGDYYCGNFGFNIVTQKEILILCPSCQALLNQMNEILGEIDKMNWDEKQGCNVFSDETIKKFKQKLEGEK